MIDIISVRFKEGGKQYYFHPQGLTVNVGDLVVVDTVRGMELATCVQGNTQLPDTEFTQPLRTVVRHANADDFRHLEEKKAKEARAMQICCDKIFHHKLDMKLVEAEYNFEGNKVIFFFTSEGRVDFRALVKDLAAALHARIELRQIGVRDEAKLLGGLGICGRPFCCNQFLDDFQPVSIKMAKTQNLSLNPTKISGTCGRLMCCLKYEQDAYEDLVKRVPRQDSFVETPDGAGSIASINLLREKVNVRLESAPEKAVTYHASEVRVIRRGKGARPEGYVQPPLSVLAKLRRIEDDAPAVDPVSVSTNPLAAALEAVFSGHNPDETVKSDRNGDRNRRNRRNGNRPRPQNEGEKSPAPQQSNENREQRPRRPRNGNRPQQQGEVATQNQPQQKQSPKSRPEKSAQKPQQKQAPNQPNKPAPNQPAPTAEGGEPRKNPRPRRRRPRSGGKPKTED